MLYSSQSFKKNLGLVSIAVITALLTSPHAYAMEVEEPEQKSLKRKEPPVEDNDGSQKKQRPEPPLSIQYSTRNAFQGLLDQAKNGDEAAQDKVMKLAYQGFWLKDITMETMNFSKWNNIHERSPMKAEYALFYSRNLTHPALVEHTPQFLKRMKERAKSRDAGAQNVVGLMYLDGNGFEQDENKAFKNFYKSAKSKNAYGQNYLSSMYKSGIGCKADPKKAFKYMEYSAKQRYAIAQFSLGKAYLEGINTNKNWDLAIEYLSLAAEQGYVMAQYYLADTWYIGEGEHKDWSIAASLYYKAFTNKIYPLSGEDKADAKRILLSLIQFNDPGEIPPDLENKPVDFEALYSKTKILNEMGLMVAQHGAGDFENPEAPLSCKSLVPLYESLASFGAMVNDFAEDLQRNLKTSEFIFLTCAAFKDEYKLNAKTQNREKFKYNLQSLLSPDKLYLCIDDNNHQLGFKLYQAVSKRQATLRNIEILKYKLETNKEALESLQKNQVNSEKDLMPPLQNLLSTQPPLGDELKMPLQKILDDLSNSPIKNALVQIETELNLLSEAQKIVGTEISKILLDIIDQTAPLRDKAFREANAELFGQ